MAMLAVLCGIAAFVVPANANTFLAAEPARAPAPPLLEELEKVLGGDRFVAVESRVRRLEEALRPTFQSMPKGPDGGLGSDGVRYVLHRIFVDRHGWFVRGLEAGGNALNQSLPAAVFKEHVGDGVHDFFEEKLDNHGFSLHHIAVLAATLESFVHSETLDRLHNAYRLTGLSQHESNSDEEEVRAVIDAYMMLYVLDIDYTNMTTRSFSQNMKMIHEIYPTWEDTKKWTREVRDEVLRSAQHLEPTSFNTTVRIMEAIGDQHGRWQDRECQDIKEKLLKLEEKGTGRVRIEKFYQSALDGNWQFKESVAYLRQMGALDESNPKKVSVIIPNYINSASNCVASSKFYSVCCMDECEALMGHLETHIAAPDASPERILELVSNLPSATATAPRTLPSALINRLDEIAAGYGGVVPLHGRLLAQWMHHAYPRECSYPHVSGTTKPMSSEEWMKQTGEKRISVNHQGMRWHIEEAKIGFQQAQAGAHGAAHDADELPWSVEEEFFVTRTEMPKAQNGYGSTLWAMGRNLMLLGAVVSFTVTLVRTFRTVTDPLKSPPNQKGKGGIEKYMV